MTSSRLIPAAVLVLAGSIMPIAAHAENTNWQICNKTPEKVSVAIAYDSGKGRYVSKGWHVLNACGGCANVGSYAIKGVWYMALGQGGVSRISGNDIFCVHLGSAFNLGKPNDKGQCSVSTSSKTKMVPRGFRSVTLSKKNFTSNIVGKVNGKVCID